MNWILNTATGGKYNEMVRDTQLKLEQERARIARATQTAVEIPPEHREAVLAVLDEAAKEHPELEADADRVRAELARNEKLPAENRSSVPNEVPEITQAGPRGPGSRGRRRSEPKFVDRFTEDNIQTMPPDLRGRLAALKEGKSLDLETDFARITRTEGKYHLSNISKDKTLYLKKDGIKGWRSICRMAT
ncbi:MAG: hypothetical protein HYU99_05335 [Deltaproteobacteria bacterium]|nr:hypothetical protein [Deltaproteobacteria bacterium]